MISGYVHPDFGGVTPALRKVAAHKRGGGAAAAVYHRGELVVDVWTGAPIPVHGVDEQSNAARGVAPGSSVVRVSLEAHGCALLKGSR